MTAPAPGPAFTARSVTSDGVVLAARDYGGHGAGLVLMHGAGMQQGSLEPLVAELLPSYRVVTFDFRGHGASGLGPWTAGTAVADITAVATALGLENPAVGGHSLGGMIAAAYGAVHPECPGVVNIDGHGLGRVEQYVGVAEADVREWWTRQRRTTARLGEVVAVLTPLAKLLGKPVPSRQATRDVQHLVDSTDWFALYRSLRCPLLVLNATADEDRPVMLRAYRAGLRRDLAALAADHSNVDVAEIDATHLLITTRPVEVARLIDDFLADQQRRG